MMVRRPALVELTGVRRHCVDDAPRRKTSRVPTVSGRMCEEEYARDQIIKRNVFGHRWVLKINENERHTPFKERPRWKLTLYVVVFCCIVVAVCFGAFFSVDNSSVDPSSSSSNHSYAIAALPSITPEEGLANHTADASIRDNLVRAQPAGSGNDAVGVHPSLLTTTTPTIASTVPPFTTAPYHSTTFFNPFLFTTPSPPTTTLFPPHLLFTRSPPPHYHLNVETTTFPSHLLFTTRAPPWLTTRAPPPLHWTTPPPSPPLHWTTPPPSSPLHWSTPPPSPPLHWSTPPPSPPLHWSTPPPSSPLHWMTTTPNPLLYWMTTPPTPPLRWTTAPPSPPLDHFKWSTSTNLNNLWITPSPTLPTTRQG